MSSPLSSSGPPGPNDQQVAMLKQMLHECRAELTAKDTQIAQLEEDLSDLRDVLETERGYRRAAWDITQRESDRRRLLGKDLASLVERWRAEHAAQEKAGEPNDYGVCADELAQALGPSVEHKS